VAAADQGLNGRPSSPTTPAAIAQERTPKSIQILTLELDEITADDYLQWVRDPEPPALDIGLRSIRVDADPVGDTITATLDWAGPAPPAQLAAPAAGLPLADGVRLGQSEYTAPPVKARARASLTRGRQIASPGAVPVLSRTATA
jgi:hypothetical protein